MKQFVSLHVPVGYSFQTPSVESIPHWSVCQTLFAGLHRSTWQCVTVQLHTAKYV